MNDIKKPSLPSPARPFVLDPPEIPDPIMPPSAPVVSFWRRTLFIAGLASLLLLFALGFLVFKGISLSERVQFENAHPHSFVAGLKHLTGSFFGKDSLMLAGEDEGRINILLLGRAGETYPGKNLTDTIMIMSIAPETKQVALLSLPRDLYVPIGDGEYYTKINSLYQYGLSNQLGVSPLKKTIERITGTPIHYFVSIDFDSFEKVVDTLGGISVEVPRDFYDPRYPGKNYSYETFEIKKGWQTLDGATALKYVRERHDDPEGDFGRAKRQQQVLQAMKDKAFSLGTLFNIVMINRLLDTLGDSVKTDMPLEAMAKLLELSRTLDTKNVTTVVIDAWKKESLLRVSHVQVGDIKAFVLIPRVGSWNEIIDVNNTLFRRDDIAKRKRAIQEEKSTVALYATASDRETALKISSYLREELGFLRVRVVSLSSLDKRPEKSIMTERDPLARPYSLDELLKRLSPTRVTTLPVRTMGGDEDFSLVIGSDLAQAFSLPEAPNGTDTPDTSFSEPLPPQRLKSR